MILGVITALVAGCGSDHRTSVLSPGFVQPADATRYPDGSPAQATIQLVQAIEYNDPSAAASFFVPAWKLTGPKLASDIRGPLRALVTIIGGNVRLVAEVRRGAHATLVVAAGSRRAVLMFEKVGTRWELSRARLATLNLAPPRARRRRPGSR